LLLNECLFLFFISLSTQSGNFWIHPRKRVSSFTEVKKIAHKTLSLKQNNHGLTILAQSVFCTGDNKVRMQYL